MECSEDRHLFVCVLTVTFLTLIAFHIHQRVYGKALKIFGLQLYSYKDKLILWIAVRIIFISRSFIPGNSLFKYTCNALIFIFQLKQSESRYLAQVFAKEKKYM